MSAIPLCHLPGGQAVAVVGGGEVQQRACGYDPPRVDGFGAAGEEAQTSELLI